MSPAEIHSTIALFFPITFSNHDCSDIAGVALFQNQETCAARPRILKASLPPTLIL
jgi:hypothetical protein